MQNVETAYWIRTIIEDGAQDWNALGRPDHPGARFFECPGQAIEATRGHFREQLGEIGEVVLGRGV